MISNCNWYENLDEPQKRGHATELIIQAGFALLDIPFLLPLSNNEPYDMVIDWQDEFHRIQCKSAYHKTSGTVAFETVSTRRRGEGYQRKDYLGDADLFAIFDPVNNNRYIVPVEEASSGKMEIRYEETKNGQKKGVNWFEDYMFEKFFREGSI